MPQPPSAFARGLGMSRPPAETTAAPSRRKNFNGPMRNRFEETETVLRLACGIPGVNHPAAARQLPSAVGCSAGIASHLADHKSVLRLLAARMSRLLNPPSGSLACRAQSCPGATGVTAHGSHGAALATTKDSTDNRTLSPVRTWPWPAVSPRVVPGQPVGTSSNTSCIRHS